MKNCIHTFKIGFWEEFFGEFFCGHYYWYTSNEFRAIWKFKIFGWKFIQNMCFLKKNKKGKIFYVFEEKTNTKWKRNRFYSWALHYFFKFFFLVMSYEPQTWSPMADKKLHIIYVVYIDFIQSSSSNRWIKINLDLKLLRTMILVIHNLFWWKLAH